MDDVNNIKVYDADDPLNPNAVTDIKVGMSEEDFDMYIMHEYFEELEAINNNTKRINDRLLRAIKSVKGQDFHDDVLDVFTDCSIASMEIVSEPQGSKQSEDYRVIKHIYVEQWTGYECDDYYGNIYIKLKKGKYLKIPYSC